ncbi:hypothetical protein ABGV42_01940 [Paenibacillus pabuli]|uniref:hypothetical protein n=1 Tax=Paenibacillus pabuli TaxID=1472 RepID=UPI003242C35A
MSKPQCTSVSSVSEEELLMLRYINPTFVMTLFIICVAALFVPYDLGTEIQVFTLVIGLVSLSALICYIDIRRKVGRFFSSKSR